MKNLANIYLYNISSYFELIELYNFKNTCKLFNKEFIDKFNKLFLNNKININNFFSKQIISLFGGENIMAFFPNLSWKDSYCGSTGYIDRINCKDVNYPIMIGVDNANRSFITISTCCNDSNPYSSKKNLTTIFQRYTNDKYTWTHGTSGISFISESQYIISRNYLQHKLIKNNLKNLLNKKNLITIQGYKDNYNINLELDYSYCFDT